MYYTYNGVAIVAGRGWTDDQGTQHPPNWMLWSEQEKADRGLVAVEEQARPDPLFYDFTRNPDGTFTVVERAAESINESLAMKIKEIAGHRIIAIAPEWRQRNLIAQAVELMRQGRGAEPEADAIQATWDRIKAIRTHSDQLEASLETLTFEEKQGLDLHAGWPE